MSLSGEEKEELKKQYFDYVNHNLSQDLLPGIEKAMAIFKENYADRELDEEEENAICLIIDGDKLAFALGDGLDVEGPDDDAVFYTFECKMLETCAKWVTDTEMNLSQEQGDWLSECITLAAEEGLFDGLSSFNVYGDSGYGVGAYDVMYEAYEDDDYEDDEDDDWNDEDE